MVRCLFVVLLSSVLGSCIVASAFSTCQSLEEGELRFAFPLRPVKEDTFHLPTYCRQYYNDGSDAWIECMQVGYK